VETLQTGIGVEDIWVSTEQGAPVSGVQSAYFIVLRVGLKVVARSENADVRQHLHTCRHLHTCQHLHTSNNERPYLDINYFEIISCIPSRKCIMKSDFLPHFLFLLEICIMNTDVTLCVRVCVCVCVLLTSQSDVK
jgi:hypothetical protein